MNHIMPTQCKRLTPSTSKSVNSFRSYDTSKIRGQNWNGKIRLFCHLSCPGNFSLPLPSPMAGDYFTPCLKTTVKLKFLHQKVSHRFWYPTGCGNKDPYCMKSSIGQFLRKCCKKRSIGRGSYKRCGIDVKFVMDRQDQV